MKIKATPIKGQDLKPGDLFSTASQEYWDNPNPGSIGEKVFIRMDTTADWAPDFDSYVYKIIIVKDELSHKIEVNGPACPTCGYKVINPFASGF